VTEILIVNPLTKALSAATFKGHVKFMKLVKEGMLCVTIV